MAVTLGNIYIKDSADWNTYLDLIYPVGSIYITTSSISPASSISGSWAQMESGNFLMTAGETYNVLSSGDLRLLLMIIQQKDTLQPVFLLMLMQVVILITSYKEHVTPLGGELALQVVW